MVDQMYGCDIDEFIASVVDSFTYEVGGVRHVAGRALLGSDAGDRTARDGPELDDHEYARETVHVQDRAGAIGLSRRIVESRRDLQVIDAFDASHVCT